MDIDKMAFTLPRRSSVLVTIIFILTLALAVFQIFTLQQSYVIKNSDLGDLLYNVPPELKKYYFYNKVVDQTKSFPPLYYISIAIAIVSGLGLFSIVFT